MKPAAAKARKQAPAPLDLRGKDLDEAIQALTIKKQTSKESFSPADLKELKRLRNIRGSRNFRQKSKEFKKETAKQDIQDLVLQCTIDGLMATQQNIKYELKESKARVKLQLKRLEQTEMRLQDSFERQAQNAKLIKALNRQLLKEQKFKGQPKKILMLEK